MSDDSFDLNNIVYANSHSKITLKSKQKLDELAAQVALWNLEKFNKTNQMDKEKGINENNKIVKSFLPNNNTSRVLSNFNHQTPVKHEEFLVDVKGSVKKKAAFFESLSTPLKVENKQIYRNNMQLKLEFPSILCLSQSNKENDYPINDDLPPPPDYVSEYEENEIVIECDNFIISNCDSKVISDIESSECAQESCYDMTSEDFTHISSLTSSQSSGSLYDEIAYELAKMDHKHETESLPDSTVDERPKSLRRSLSFNDTIEYIYPSSADESSDADEDEKHEEDKSHRSSICSQTTDGHTQNEVGFSTVILEAEMEILKQKSMELLNSLSMLLLDFRFQLGGDVHTDICMKIVKNGLVTKSLAEQIHRGSQYLGVIEGNLSLHDMKFAIKEQFVVIDYEHLVNQGLADRLEQLKTFYHMIIFVRCEADSSVSESRVFTFVTKSEAVRLGLVFQRLEWLEMFEYINFMKLKAGFRLVFDLHCMSVTPQKYLTKNRWTPKKRTPIKKIYCNSPVESERSLSFNNIGSFDISAKGLQSDDKIITRHVKVPLDCPFTGKLRYTGSLNLELVSKCSGRLNVYMDIGGVGAWTFKDCEISHTTIIIGTKSKKTGEIDVELTIPFWMCSGPAVPCEYHICAKSNSFSVLLHEFDTDDNMPVNRRLSTDGKRKNRFLAAAETDADLERWCSSISEARSSFIEWSNCVD